MTHFVLVHGSFHGGWCWTFLTPHLIEAGHRVSTPNLPMSGGDPAPLAEADLAHYADRIAETVMEVGEKVVLVGHSMGGIVASQVAERIPEKLRAVVYICGLMLRSGESLGSFLGEVAHLQVEDLVLKNMRVAPDGLTATFPPEKAAEVLYNTCTPEDARWAAERLTPQATKVYGEPLALTPERFGSVRRFYIKGLRDQAVAPVYQDTMIANSPCEEVFEIDSDHSPFLSCPARLAGILKDVAGRTEASPSR
ncbi:acetoin dehydrogenase E2 subunit dihydrolipoyllysine-residue acetyltransferase [Hartmannibacter diazotrophicus]|uniref:Acetoin dehydrogenase E2 subunit dihydrolipoyllysine-residue acetyltransferase n=1 Tax=Hartmannibacter diazotrophicus TaxID=1482074 RepID=A0A2C9D5V8_9HYPH|nr:alpha/beta fold hydrolase [Hartmannibacter diazotrophicus]SON55686.1 acetoin dehydrogenase E2 subunit dihydrolipoyllysine-residue acetyltransferase [Hartmannibacter diazotrophicus]